MECNRTATLVNKIRTQQAQFIGHAMRGHSLEHLATTAKIEQKRAGGRQREKTLDGIGSMPRTIREN